MITYNDVVPDRMLGLHASFFRCPYCGNQWQRGGKREGFLKAGASRHVRACREFLLFRAGYLAIGNQCPSDGKCNSFVIAVTGIDVASEWHTRVKRQMVAASRRRAIDFPNLKIPT